MATSRGCRRHRCLSALAALALLFFATALGGSLAGGAARDGEEVEERLRVTGGGGGAAARRRLIGPGSSPPTCRARCGRCSPCRPVHVAVHPGRIIPLDYYPEAWRCKCGSKLFMP